MLVIGGCRFKSYHSDFYTNDSSVCDGHDAIEDIWATGSIGATPIVRNY